MHVMILAAGRGSRLRPWTDHRPKPLIPIRGEPLIGRLLGQLAQAGFRSCVINVAYLGDQIQAYCGDGSLWGISIAYSEEGPEPIGTAAGIRRVLPILGTAPFAVISGDIWTDYPFAQWHDMAAQWTWNRLAHIVLVDNPIENPCGDFGYDPVLQRCVPLGQLPLDHPTGCLTYASMGIVAPALLDQRPDTAELGPLLRTAIAQGAVGGEYFVGQWANVGVWNTYYQLQGGRHRA